jgi:hypothetical protein
MTFPRSFAKNPAYKFELIEELEEKVYVSQTDRIITGYVYLRR